MEYERIYRAFFDYVNKCRNKILVDDLTIGDAYGLNITGNELDIIENVRNRRLKMINIKIEHTARMVEQVIKISQNLGLNVDLTLVIKIATLYHDIGRIRQATWSNSFADSFYKIMNKPFSNHGEEGYDIFLNNDFCIDRQYVPIVGQVILHHQDVHTQKNLQYRYSTDISKIRIDDVATGKFELNEAEWQIASLIVQLVADIDKTDILYQHLSDDFDMIRDYVNDKSMDTLDNIANYWCISKREIIDYNNIDEKNYKPRTIRIPIYNMDLNRLIVPGYMREMFYNNSWLELRELAKDKNWNFITILWWRLSHFLNQISFNSVLINIEESELLDQIYEKIPNELRFLVDEAFVYAGDQLIRKRIKDNRGNIYIK